MFPTNLNKLALDSREVAQMVKKPHNDLLKSIRQYCEYLGEGEISQSDFFVESTYQNTQNKTLPCFLVTRKGCDFIAHKLTGKDGVQFTAAYINRFYEMENSAPPAMSLETLARMYSSAAAYTNSQGRILINEGHTWHDVGRMAKDVARAAGLPYSPLLGTPPANEQLALDAWGGTD